MSYLPNIMSHLDAVAAATERLELPMWPAVLDVRSGWYPEGEHVPRRVYRLIGAPRGSTLYWDQPLIVAAYALSKQTGEPRFAERADAYIDAFLEQCIGEHGVWRWGNHAYFDVFTNEVVEFHGGPHELRPITPAWELFWRRAPEATARYLWAMARRHVYDVETGGFNRHDDQQKSHAFIEAGGILCESLAWLYGKTNEEAHLKLARRIATYSLSHRGKETGLLVNEPDHGRWDSRVATTETGLWAQCLLRAGSASGEVEFTDMATGVTRAYLRHGWLPEAQRYAGQLDIQSGAPVVPESPGYWPRQYANPWNTDQWPTHDYPMPLAEAALTLHERTSDSFFAEAVERWAGVVEATRPRQRDGWAYAEDYGRCIHFLTRAGLQMERADYLDAARDLAREALDALSAQGMLQGYAGDHVYESVDGVGFLCLALLYLESGEEPPGYGFGF